MSTRPPARPPAVLDDLPVVCFTRLDARHRPTGTTRHTVGGVLQGPAAGLAIVDGGREGYYLFYCDAQWSVVTDTWHETLEDAKAQAEFEYAGTVQTWERAG